MANESLVIYSINKVGRIILRKQILRDISLGFYYGTKIGVLGLNSAGKSTQLRIVAGIDKDYIRENSLSRDYTAGLLARFDEVNAKLVESDADFDASSTSKLNCRSSSTSTTHGISKAASNSPLTPKTTRLFRLAIY